MYPILKYTKGPSLTQLKISSIIIFLKEYLRYISRYLLPNFLGNLIDLTIGNYFGEKYGFIRAFGDHFGNWNCIFLFIRSVPDNTKKKFICFAKKGTINPYWFKYFNNKNIVLIYNPFLRFLLSSFLFSTKLSIEVNGHIALSFTNLKSYKKKYKRMDPIDSNFMKKNKISFNKKYKLKKLFNKPHILFYGRTGEWKYSIKNSKRNMSEKVKLKILSSISKEYNIFLIGDTSLKNIDQLNNVFSEKDLKDLKTELSYVYSTAKCVIGSMSGATHFPSTLFNLKTLYIGENDIEGIAPLYLFSKNIPSKDNYLILKNKNILEISNSKLSQFLNNFIKFNKKIPLENISFYKYSSNDGCSYSLSKNKFGNILIHDKLSFKRVSKSK